ncbi:MAG: hypothetical protein JWP92_984 [Caulobacter sp.]|nr:hypothetical protein [Caulobacter sp.]
MTEKPKADKDKAVSEKAAREARLAQALRQNLRRRKAGADSPTKDDPGS